jgi:hypothetical protein
MAGAAAAPAGAASWGISRPLGVVPGAAPCHLYPTFSLSSLPTPRLAGEIFQSAAASQAASPSGGGGGGGSRGGGGGGRPKRDAKEAMERAFLAVMERRMAADAEEDALAAAGQ